ncbi:hypothetical protein CXQ67_RS05990 [Staphylococcus pseudintermedius]|nr:hypothetical protein [Staphylococcus pseudintermedius]
MEEFEKLRIGSEVQVKIGKQRMKDTDDNKYLFEPIFENAIVRRIDKAAGFAVVELKSGNMSEINEDVEWYTVPKVGGLFK